MADVTDATFTAEVLERSATIPVVVDLWAPWCGPCKTLGPIIEKVIAETNGAVELAKVNVDENPQTSQAFQVQGIPAVYALKDGQVVDGFVGAKGESEVREFVQGLLPSADESRIEELIEAGDESSLIAALEIQPDHPGAVVALAEHLVGKGETETALKLLTRVPENAETRRVAALARTGVAVPEEGAEDVPDDFDAKFEALLPTVKSDDDARQQFVDLLEVLGPDDPRTAGWRKKLTSALF